jgi:hypothetical protein
MEKIFCFISSSGELKEVKKINYNNENIDYLNSIYSIDGWTMQFNIFDSDDIYFLTLLEENNFELNSDDQIVINKVPISVEEYICSIKNFDINN